MQGRVASKMVAKVDNNRLAQFSTRRTLDLPVEKIAELISKVQPQKAPDKQAICSTPEEVKGEIKTVTDPIVVDCGYDQPVLGDDGELIWIPGSRLPPILQKAKQQCIISFKIGNDVEKFAVRLWKPRDVNETRKHKIEKTAIGVVIRVMAAIGSTECFRMVVDHGKIHTETNMICKTGEALSMGSGSASAMDFVFDDKTSVVEEAKNGFRPKRIHKNPAKTYVLVIDGLMNPEALLKQLKSDDKLLKRPESKIQPVTTDGKETVEEVPQLISSSGDADVDAALDMLNNMESIKKEDSKEPLKVSVPQRVLSSKERKKRAAKKAKKLAALQTSSGDIGPRHVSDSVLPDMKQSV